MAATAGCAAVRSSGPSRGCGWVPGPSPATRPAAWRAGSPGCRSGIRPPLGCRSGIRPVPGCGSGRRSASGGILLAAVSGWAARAVVAKGLSAARSFQNCSSETPPNSSAGHSSSSTPVPLRQATRRRDLAVMSASSGSAWCEPRAAIRCVAATSGASSWRPPCRARCPVTRGPESSSAIRGSVKSIKVLGPVPSAPPAARPGRADRAGLAGRAGPPDEGGEVLLRLARRLRGRPARPGPPGRAGSAGSAASATPSRDGLVPGTARAHAEVEGCRYAGKSHEGESRDQDHGLHPECRAGKGYRDASQAHAADDARLAPLVIASAPGPA